MKVLGFPRFALYAYLMVVVIMGLLGLVGLKQDAMYD